MTKIPTETTYTGTLSKHMRGFGFVVCDDLEGDIFVPAKELNGAMDGDVVEVELAPAYLWKDSPQGTVKTVVKRALTQVAGRFEKSGKFGFVVPDGKKLNDDIFVNKKNFSGAQTGDRVVVEIIEYPEGGRKAEGKITEIIGHRGDAGADIKAIARNFGMRETFPSRANAQAKAIRKKGVTEEDMKGRRDLRDKIVYTIDGADSKDFDDAVSIDKLPNGNYLLGVHIADVSHYVREGDYLDKEALNRGTSVYLLDQVIPMLPKALSNDICSLRPGVDRLTLSVDMEINSDGDVVNHDIYEAVINSTERLVYDDVSDMIENDDPVLFKKYAHIAPQLMAMSELALLLRKKREARGSIDFDLDEAWIKLNKAGRAVDVGIVNRRSANKLIEEFMLLANETVAEHFFWMEVPFLYRVHEKPEIDKIESLKAFLNSMDIVLRGSSENIHPRSIRSVLDMAKGQAHENVVNSVTLRSMQKAYYDTECRGHFGLALRFYSHFTSPIRRYPDLMIHRIIKDIIHNGVSESLVAHYKEVAQIAADLSSKKEREAIECEREVEKFKKAEYMEQFIGEAFPAIISGVTSFGFYAQLDNTIEGLVHINDLDDDWYDFVEKKYALVGEQKGRTYKLGDKVDVIVDSVNVPMGEINFVLLDWFR
ncbi:MAG: ribonuclease R [Eubacterium sp.]|nr:ribonuclease R [Candidatus Colimonas fimequi]